MGIDFGSSFIDRRVWGPPDYGVNRSVKQINRSRKAWNTNAGRSSRAASSLGCPRPGRPPLLARSGLRGHRQGEVERCAGSAIAGGPYPPAVGLDDRAADRQTHPHAVGLGGEESVEQAMHAVFIDADSGA